MKVTLDINKSDKAIKTRILTCFPVFGQIKSNIAFKMYREEIFFDPPLSGSVGPDPLWRPCH